MSIHTFFLFLFLFLKKCQDLALPCQLFCSGDHCAGSLKDSSICPLERTEAQWEIRGGRDLETVGDGGKWQKRLQADLDSYQLGCFRLYTNLELCQPGVKSAGCTTTEIYPRWHPTPEASLLAQDTGTGATRKHLSGGKGQRWLASFLLLFFENPGEETGFFCLF